MNEEIKRNIMQLETMFDDCMHAIHLKQNMKFPGVRHCVIILSDVMHRAYRIREMVQDADTIGFMMYNNPDAPIVAEYDSVEDMVADGWRVD